MVSGKAGSSPPTRQPQSERTDSSRRTLIDATITLLAEEGYRAATVNRIQDLTGLSRGLVGYHFGSKDQLLEAVVDHIRTSYLFETGQTDATGVSGLEQVRHMFETYFTRLDRDPRPAKVMLVLATETAASGSEVAVRVRRAFADVRTRIATMLKAGITDGSVVPGIDPEVHALVLHGVLRGVVMQYLLDPGAVDLQSARKATLSLLDRDLGAS